MPVSPDIFGIGLAGIINNSLGPMVFDLTLTVVTPGTRGADLTAGTQPTEATHSAKGFTDEYDDKLIDGTRIQEGDRKISILGGSLPAGVIPQEDDKILAEGKNWIIIRVKRDPAAAVYSCQAR